MLKITHTRTFNWSIITSVIVTITYILNWRYAPMWWLILFFADLVVFLFYFTVFTVSVVFLIRDRKKFRYFFVPLCINIIPIFIICCSPSRDGNKHYHRDTVDLDKSKNCSCHLHLESYFIHGGGAMGSDLISIYLTDSVNFSEYIGTYDDEEEMISTRCKGDSINIEKTINTRSYPAINSTKTYSLKLLKKAHHFD